MKPVKSALLLTTILIANLLWIPLSLAAPNEINFQGQLTDINGDPVPDGSYLMQFYLYETPTGADALWGVERYVSVTNGVFNVNLGEENPLDPSHFTGDDRYLEVRIVNPGTSTETLSPRQKLTSVAYALQAQEAISVVNGAIATDMIQDQAIDQVKLADNAVSGAKIEDGSITSDDIDDGMGSGLDADTLDGLSSGAFSPSSHAHSSLNAADGYPTNSVYVDNSGNVGIGTTSPESGHKLHVNGLSIFELGSGRVAMSTPGGKPGFIAWHNDGTRSDIAFHDDGVFIAKNELNAIPEQDNGLMVHENGRVGIGTLAPNARLEVRGEVRTTDQYGGTRLWGQGRPNTKRYGTTGVESGLCSYGQVKFGLSLGLASWDNAASVCPAGTWVCTAAERGDYSCDTQRPDYIYVLYEIGDALNCSGDLLNIDADKHRGWLADQYQSGSNVSEYGYSMGEDGVSERYRPCRYYPVWCCSSLFD